MRKKLIIILSLILLISLAAGCSSGNTEDITSTSASATETVSEASTTTATTTTSTTKATTTTKAITTAKTENSTTSTTKKAVSASKAKATKDKKTHTQINSFCYITVECSSILDNMNNLKEGHESFVPKSGEIISKTKCTFKENDSAYDILEKTLKDRGIGKTELSVQLGLSSRTIAKIGKGEKLSNRSLQILHRYDNDLRQID